MSPETSTSKWEGSLSRLHCPKSELNKSQTCVPFSKTGTTKNAHELSKTEGGLTKEQDSAEWQ
jgi:hypothetical protein